MSAGDHPTYTLAEAARLCGVSGDRLRKAWGVWANTWAFPAPFKRPPLANYAWEAAAVDAWIAGRTKALGDAAREPVHEARDVPPPLVPGSAAAARLIRERAELDALMARA